MGIRKQAFMAARQFRLCPGPEIVKNPLFREKVRQHRRICPLCCPHPDEEATAWEELAAEIAKRLEQREIPAGRENPMPGDLRWIRPEYSRWHRGFYYSPPLVLVLEKLRDHVRVAQTFHDALLAGPGDLILEKQDTGLSELFVETWNTWLIPLTHAGSWQGEIRPELLKIIRQCIAHPDQIPDIFPSPRPVVPEDVRRYFRDMEKKVGKIFSFQADLPFGSAQEVCGTLRHLKPGIHWRRMPESAAEALACAYLCADEYALAAQEEEAQWGWANLVELCQGRVESFRPVQADILMWEYAGQELSISGQIRDIPEYLIRTRMLCFLSIGAEDIAVPDYADWNETQARFFLIFRNPEQTDGRLSLAIIGERDESQTY